jgi:hypothetical protein
MTVADSMVTAQSHAIDRVSCQRYERAAEVDSVTVLYRDKGIPPPSNALFGPFSLRRMVFNPLTHAEAAKRFSGTRFARSYMIRLQLSSGR